MVALHAEFNQLLATPVIALITIVPDTDSAGPSDIKLLNWSGQVICGSF